eukprot:gene39077-11088_t
MLPAAPPPAAAETACGGGAPVPPRALGRLSLRKRVNDLFDDPTSSRPATVRIIVAPRGAFNPRAAPPCGTAVRHRPISVFFLLVILLSTAAFMAVEGGGAGVPGARSSTRDTQSPRRDWAVPTRSTKYGRK